MGHRIQHSKTYPSALTDEPWALLGPLSPPATQSHRGGRPRTVDLREGLQTLCSLNRRGCQWEMLPHDVLPKRTVYDSCAPGRDDGTWAKMVQAWREQPRVHAGCEPTPSAIGIESQALKTPEMGGPARRYEGGQQINGRTRPLGVEPLGL